MPDGITKKTFDSFTQDDKLSTLFDLQSEQNANTEQIVQMMRDLQSRNSPSEIECMNKQEQCKGEGKKQIENCNTRFRKIEGWQWWASGIVAGIVFFVNVAFVVILKVFW